MLGEDRWAKKTLVIFDLSSGPVFGYVEMNGAYYESVPGHPQSQTNKFVGVSGFYNMAHNGSIFFEDVTKYRKLVITAKWERIPEEGIATIGFLNKKENGDFESAFGLHLDVVPSDLQKTYTFDIENLEGLQKFRMKCNYIFTDDKYSTFQIIKMVLE